MITFNTVNLFRAMNVHLPINHPVSLSKPQACINCMEETLFENIKM